MECEEVVSRLWEYLDQELAPEEAEEVGVHLMRCVRCHPRFCCDRALLELLARQRVECPIPPGLVFRVRRCLRAH
jgi:anti-sigma factor RsiW